MEDDDTVCKTPLLKRNTPPICIKLCIVRNPVILLNGRATLSHFPLRWEKSVFTFYTSSYNDAKIVVLRHCRRKCKRGGISIKTTSTSSHPFKPAHRGWDLMR